MKKTFLCVAVMALFMTSFLGCATVPVTGRRQVSFISQGQLKTQSSLIYENILETSTVVEDTDQARRVREVGQKIADASERFMIEHGMGAMIQFYDWQFALLKDDENVNAFCLPGGRIGVYTGLFKVAPDEASLAAVLGHEAAHAIAQHGNERMSQQLLVELGHLTLTTALSESPEETQQLWNRVYGIGSTVGVLLPYSRRQEQEADHIGLIIMAKAGYDPNAALGLWLRMRELQTQRPIPFLSTHPAPEDRIDHIRSLMPQAMEYYE